MINLPDQRNVTDRLDRLATGRAAGLMVLGTAFVL